jgi:SAM-dependent methyltransferase
MNSASKVPSSASRQRVLYVSSSQEKRCGVYQFGKNVGSALEKSLRYEFVTADCSSADDLKRAISRIQPAAIIYNYHPLTLSWVTAHVTYKIQVPQIGTIHECSQEAVDAATNDIFDAHVAPDPTLLLRNPLVFKTGRLVLPYVNTHHPPEIPTIGSFGFGLEGKGFEKVIEAVQREFDQAHIRLHIPFSPFLDRNGTCAAEIRRRCEQLIFKPGIRLSLSHQFFSEEEMLDFLAGNTVNAFFYDTYRGRGISSVTDYALAVGRPIALSKSEMFRHFNLASPEIFIEEAPLKQIIACGFAPLKPLRREWSEDNLVWDYERAVSHQLAARPSSRPHPLLVGGRSILRRLRKRLRRMVLPQATVGWIRPDTTGMITPVPQANEVYRAAVKREGSPLNRILDNVARVQYEPAIQELFRLAPEMLARKIPEANVQQAFVLDTVHELAVDAKAHGAGLLRLLCVGSYEDSAAASLRRLGYRFEEIDPVINYSLHEFCSRPSTVMESYDIVFSTSVIEHVSDDEEFLMDLASLLAPGGTAMLTCDYQDQYRPGDPKPSPDYRLYTQRDFTERLLPLLKDCALVDSPRWDCPAPDFIYEGCRYTFAALVFRKQARKE